MVVSFATAQSPSTNPPAVSSDIAAVRQQMLALRSAELQYDTTAAAKLLADGFLLSAADGTLYTKERFLKLVGDKNNPLELFEYSEMEIHTYGTTAVVFSRLHEKGFMDGKPYELNGRPIWTWVKRERVWVCVTRLNDCRNRIMRAPLWSRLSFA
jgi:ketosteroid isomerase-like protein